MISLGELVRLSRVAVLALTRRKTRPKAPQARSSSRVGRTLAACGLPFGCQRHRSGASGTVAPGLAGTEGTAADADADAPSVPSVPSVDAPSVPSVPASASAVGRGLLTFGEKFSASRRPTSGELANLWARVSAMGRTGFEPAKAITSGFTIRPL